MDISKRKVSDSSKKIGCAMLYEDRNAFSGVRSIRKWREFIKPDLLNLTLSQHVV